MTTPSRTGTPYILNASAGDASSNQTIPADCNLIVAFWCHYIGAAGHTGVPSINGTPMTVLSEVSTSGAPNYYTGQGVAIMVNPPTGSQSHAMTWSTNTARAEGGQVVFVYYKDGNTGDPYRAHGAQQASGATVPTVNLASTATTDRVVGFTQRYTTTSEACVITGVTAFIDDSDMNSEAFDVGDDTGLSGTVAVAISAGTADYSSTAAVSLKESVGGGGGGISSVQVDRGRAMARGLGRSFR